ncbi:hypothetical protein RJT34_28997 [Clitoria ternatea]|uniref:PPM-type phosphatase domain-containing protein n=1 Tax=Clitoria ternatea TaxID=43366 RepID=A0AAN9F9M6_CLITE
MELLRIIARLRSVLMHSLLEFMMAIVVLMLPRTSAITSSKISLILRSIGDAFLKRPEFWLDSSYPWFYVPEPITRPVLSAEPSVSSRVLQPTDKFLIFASDGLWENLTNKEAAEIVHRNTRKRVVAQELSYRGGSAPSNFRDIQELM